MSITAHTDAKAACQGPLEETPPSVLAALAHGFEQRDVESSKPTHKIRVDFKVGFTFLFFCFVLNDFNLCFKNVSTYCWDETINNNNNNKGPREIVPRTAFLNSRAKALVCKSWDIKL